LIQPSIRQVFQLDAVDRLRGAASAFRRITNGVFIRPARSLARLPEAFSRLEEIDRRTSKLDRDIRNQLPVDDDFSRAGAELVGKNVLSLKQSWPLSSTAFSHRITANLSAPVPPLTSRARIQGAKCVKDFPEDHHFLNSGVSDLRAVYNIAGVFGVDLDQPISVLDFGVGCARMARHLSPTAKAGFTGVDVDTVNIAWCAQNMDFGRYEAILPGSTIPAADRQFDLIYSHSVFTHLSPGEQNHWLQELGRVSKGLIILSVHGLYSSFRIAAWSREPKVLANWLKTGFVDAGVPNPDINDVVDAEYYRDVAHTPAYIREHWSKFVDVVEIIPGGFGNVHDAVVLRGKRG
jgi:SAM-dependent methyltransferase